MSLNALDRLSITMDALCTTGQSRTARLIKRSTVPVVRGCWDGLLKGPWTGVWGGRWNGTDKQVSLETVAPTSATERDADLGQLLREAYPLCRNRSIRSELVSFPGCPAWMSRV